MSVATINNVPTPQPIIQSIRKVLSKISDVAQKVFNKIKEAYAACKDAFVAFKAKVTGSPVRERRQAIVEDDEAAAVDSNNTPTSDLDERTAVAPTTLRRAVSFNDITSNSATQRPQLRRARSEGNLPNATVSSNNTPTSNPDMDAAATIIEKNFRDHSSRVANRVKSENTESASSASVIATVTPANTVMPRKDSAYATAALAVVAAVAGTVIVTQNQEALNQIVNDSKVLAGLALETGTRLSDKVVDGVFSGAKVASEFAKKIVAENFPNIQPIKGGFAYNFRS